MGVRVLIPAFNEAKAIGDIVRQIKSLGLDVLVIDDGSADKTFELALKNSAQVFRHVSNMGKGASLREGFNDTLKKGYEAVIVMDGDGQHDPREIERFLEKAKEPDTDIIVGNRMGDVSSMPFKRKLTNRTMSFLISKIAGQHIPDSQCGFRLIKTRVLKNIKLSTSNYEIESELLVKAGKKGYRICSVPISTIYKDHKSQINPFLDTIRFFRFLFRMRGKA